MRTDKLNIHTGILLAAITLSACTNTPVPPAETLVQSNTNPGNSTSSSTLGNTPVTSSSTLQDSPKTSGFSYSYTVYKRFSEKRKTYTYSSNDTPVNRDEQEYKKEIKLVYKILKDFLNRTSVLVERYAHSPYINKTDREKILKDSNDPEKTGPVVVSILKDVYGPQSPNVDLTKIETSICQLSGTEWDAFFEELKSALKEHKKSIKSEKHKSKGDEKKELKEDKHFINDLLDHEIWRLVKEAREEDSAEHQALLYLKRQQCGGEVPAAQTQAVKTETEVKSAENNDPRSDENYYKDLDKDKDGSEQQPLGVRYYSPEQLEQLPQPDPQAPNVFTLDPEEQKLMLGT